MTDRPAFEITEEMLKAGADILLSGINWDTAAPLLVGPYTAKRVAAEIYKAMANIRADPAA